MAEILGIVLSVAAAVLFGAAVIIQKYSMKGMKKFSIAALIFNRIWMLSIAVSGAGFLCYLLAISYVSVSSVQPIISLSTVVPVVGGAFLFRETMGVKSWLCISIIATGIAVVSIY